MWHCGGLYFYEVVASVDSTNSAIEPDSRLLNFAILKRCFCTVE